MYLLPFHQTPAISPITLTLPKPFSHYFVFLIFITKENHLKNANAGVGMNVCVCGCAKCVCALIVEKGMNVEMNLHLQELALLFRVLLLLFVLAQGLLVKEL